MVLRDARPLLFPILVVAATATSCSSKPATASAFVSANLEPSSGAAEACNFGSATTILTIGKADPTMPVGDNNPQNANDGASQGGSVSLDCKVHQTGGTFEIALNASVTNQLSGGGGSMTIRGTGLDPSTGGTVQGAFAAGAVKYEDPSCTLSYTFEGQPISLQNGARTIAPGRIWAHIECPDASAQGQSGQNVTCDANADFVFENCAVD